jgi:Domain of unknown function (DUF5666)
MNKGRTAGALMFMLLISLLLFNDGFSEEKREGEAISLSGRIEDVSKDHKSIIVHGQNFLISQETKIVDQKGNRLRSGDLKANLNVAVDAIPHPSGYTAKKVVLIKDRGV